MNHNNFKEVESKESDNRSSTITKIILAPLYIYSPGIFFAFIYFDWKNAQEMGVFLWATWGQLKALLCAIVWPYFAFFS